MTNDHYRDNNIVGVIVRYCNKSTLKTMAIKVLGELEGRGSREQLQQQLDQHRAFFVKTVNMQVHSLKSRFSWIF